jgi:hypothetical protein
MPINFDQPQTTTAYASVLSYVRDHVSALSKLLEGETLSGTVPTGAKRYNAGTTFFDRWNGSSWVEMPLGYLKLSGGTLTGALSGTSASFSGTVSGTFSGTFSGNGSAITNLNASNLASGTVPTARLGSGTANAATFLRGDGVWTNGISGDYFRVFRDTFSGIEIRTPDQTVDTKTWYIITIGGNFHIRAYTDDFSSSQPAIELIRSGATITGWNFYVNNTSVISANNNRQVTISSPTSGTHTINGGFTSGGSILVNSTTGLPATVTSNNVAIAAGYSSPVAGRILFGDNTGWKLQFGRRVSGLEYVIAELLDNGSFYFFNTAGPNYSWHVFSNVVYIGVSNNYQFSLFQNNVGRLFLDTDGKCYTSSDAGYNEIGFRRVPRTTDTTLDTAKVARCIAVTAGVTIPANTYAAGDSFSIYNDSASSITLTQGSGLTLRQSGTSNTGNRTLAARGMATIWFNSATEAIVMGDVT